MLLEQLDNDVNSSLVFEKPKMGGILKRLQADVLS